MLLHRYILSISGFILCHCGRATIDVKTFTHIYLSMNLKLRQSMVVTWFALPRMQWMCWLNVSLLSTTTPRSFYITVSSSCTGVPSSAVIVQLCFGYLKFRKFYRNLIATRWYAGRTIYSAFPKAGSLKPPGGTLAEPFIQPSTQPEALPEAWSHQEIRRTGSTIYLAGSTSDLHSHIQKHLTKFNKIAIQGTSDGSRQGSY